MLRREARAPIDPPPLKWSALRYVFGQDGEAVLRGRAVVAAEAACLVRLQDQFAELALQHAISAGLGQGASELAEDSAEQYDGVRHTPIPMA